ncbi:fibronectin type III domain-containing protein [Allorhizocola rhizosphaerae]|uniref:fibronectin type III domain-containing protein n=1 Tax=Allorhizocola rhizosphaerae TaxID=1872709 RepID=UPI000E3C357F|nr:fibronectin type III domain-containing protein [Allorhizocola rhizosphaerae]
MVDLSPGAISRKARTKGGIVTIVTVLSLIAGMGATWFGLSLRDHADASHDASSWVWSTIQGELARINGLTAKVDTRHAVQGAQGHTIELSQSDRYLIMRDLATGKVSSFDPATLSITSTMDTQQGAGIRIALHNDAAFIIDPAQGIVRQLDPTTLQPVGQTLSFPPGITGGSFDGQGRLWVAVPSEGTVTAITPAARGNQGGQGGAASPSLARTEPVSEPYHDLALSALDNGVAVLDVTNGKLVALRNDVITTVSTDAAGGDLPTRTGGDVVPVTLIEGRNVYLVQGEGNDAKVNTFTVPGNGKLQPAVAWAGRIYIADDTNGIVYVLEHNGTPVNTIKFKHAGQLQLEVREGHLFINSPGSSQAQVVNDKHEVKEVDKFRDDVPGGTPPNIPPPPDPEPPVDKPSAPGKVQAAGGDNQVALTWSRAADNGSRVFKYIVKGNGQTWEVGANQRSLVITGLVNGQEYEFTVSAVNGKGEGPGRKSNKVIPTRDVPDPPTDVKAKANPDGTVEVTWTPANGQGRKIVRYEVTAITAGTSALAGSNGGENRIVLPDKELDYGKQYSFTVVAINELGAGSKASAPVSNSVVPFTKPGAVVNLAGRTVPDQEGAVQFTWQPAPANGRAIQHYEVVAGGKTVTVTTLNAIVKGFRPGEIVTGVVRAVNEAGKGPDKSATAKTIAPATVSNVRTTATNYQSIEISFAHNDGGGTPTCKLTVNGSERTIPCNSGAGGYTLSGLMPGKQYDYTVRVENAAGGQTSGKVDAAARALRGTVRCINQPEGPTYCNGGIGVYGAATQSSNSVGDAKNGTDLQAFCKRQGEEIYAYVYNNNKRSTWWIRVNFSGENYIPWAWFQLDDGDSLNNLPVC